MENEVFNRYVDFVTKMRTGDGFDLEAFNYILSEIDSMISSSNCVPKKICLILINMIIDIEGSLNFMSDSDSEQAERAIGEFLLFIDLTMNS
jgi:hypothetical protein